MRRTHVNLNSSRFKSVNHQFTGVTCKLAVYNGLQQFTTVYNDLQATFRLDEVTLFTSINNN